MLRLLLLLLLAQLLLQLQPPQQRQPPLQLQQPQPPLQLQQPQQPQQPPPPPPPQQRQQPQPPQHLQQPQQPQHLQQPQQPQQRQQPQPPLQLQQPQQPQQQQQPQQRQQRQQQQQPPPRQQQQQPPPRQPPPPAVNRTLQRLEEEQAAREERRLWAQLLEEPCQALRHSLELHPDSGPDLLPDLPCPLVLLPLPWAVPVPPQRLPPPPEVPPVKIAPHQAPRPARLLRLQVLQVALRVVEVAHSVLEPPFQALTEVLGLLAVVWQLQHTEDPCLPLLLSPELPSALPVVRRAARRFCLRAEAESVDCLRAFPAEARVECLRPPEVRPRELILVQALLQVSQVLLVAAQLLWLGTPLLLLLALVPPLQVEVERALSLLRLPSELVARRVRWLPGQHRHLQVSLLLLSVVRLALGARPLGLLPLWVSLFLLGFLLPQPAETHLLPLLQLLPPPAFWPVLTLLLLLFLPEPPALPRLPPPAPRARRPGLRARQRLQGRVAAAFLLQEQELDQHSGRRAA